MLVGKRTTVKYRASKRQSAVWTANHQTCFKSPTNLKSRVILDIDTEPILKSCRNHRRSEYTGS